MLFNFEQLINAPFPISVTLSGIFIDVKFIHPANALSPISSTLFGMYPTECKFLHPSNVPARLHTPCSISTFLISFLISLFDFEAIGPYPE